MRTLFLVLGIFTSIAVSHGQPCGSPPHPPSYTIGLAAQLVFPNDIPQFRTSLPAYGLLGSVPIGSHALQLQGVYGRGKDTSLLLVETNFRFNIVTPFVDIFLVAGPHYMDYAYLGTNEGQFGGHGGPGLRFKLGDALDGQLSLKLYFQRTTVVAFGGGLAFLL